MTVFQALFLGLVQGLTEFLPISSSGHLALSQYFIGVNEGTLSFDVFLHFSTLLAVILFFRKRIRALRLVDFWYLGVATVPAVIVGLLFKDVFEQASNSIYVVLAALFFTGVLNIGIASMLKKRSTMVSETITTKKAVLIGVFQALALVPGISRSGSTVFGSIYSRLSRQDAFEFSFIMSIPVILGGSILQLLSVSRDTGVSYTNTSLFLVGGIAAFTAGLVSLKLLRYVIDRAKFEWFGWYCIGLVVFVALFDILPRL